jgi:hypothetical protein
VSTGQWTTETDTFGRFLWPTPTQPSVIARLVPRRVEDSRHMSWHTRCLVLCSYDEQTAAQGRERGDRP